jgi:hypothetical protein
MVEQVVSFPVPIESRKDVLFTEVTNRLLAYIREDWLKVDEETLAKRLNVNSDLIVEIELGLVAADIAHIFKFSEATGIPVARIMGAVQIVERWMSQTNAKALEACFTMPDPRHAFLKLHRLIDVGIREMPMPLRVTFDAPVKPSNPAVAAPSVPAKVQVEPPKPAPPPEPPLKLTPIAEVVEDEPDIVEDDEDDYLDDDDDDEPAPQPKMAPYEPELVEIRPLAHLFDTPKRVQPVVVVKEGVKKRGRPRKNPL